MKIVFVIPYLNTEANLYVNAVASVHDQEIPDGVQVYTSTVLDGSLCSGLAVLGMPPHGIIDHVQGRVYAAQSIARGIKNAAKFFGLNGNDVIILLDGDDELYGTKVVKRVYQTYNQYNCKLTYGSFVKKSRDGKLYYSKYRNGANIRIDKWRASHLKTFTYGLWRHLPESELWGPNGDKLRVCSDLAIMFPLIEMAGWDRIRFIQDCLYVYNDESPLNDHKVRGREQKEIEFWIRGKKPYQRLAIL